MPTVATAAWPDPQLSIGRVSAVIKRKTIWEATGPALDKFENQIFQTISTLLETHKDHLEEGEEISRTYSFHLWMVGKDAQSARPTVIFTCKSAKFRAKVIKLIKKHDIFSEFPGFALNSMDRMPAVPMGPQLDADDEWTPEMVDSVVIGATVYARGNPIDVCGALVSMGGEDETTLGGVILVGESYYGIIALHPPMDNSSDSDSILCKHGDLRFDDDSDATSSANVSLHPRRTSLSIQTPNSSIRDLRKTLTYNSSRTSQLLPQKWYATSSTLRSKRNVGDANSPFQRYVIGKVVEVSTQNGLHYGIFLISDPRYKIPNRITLPRGVNDQGFIFPETVAEEVREVEIWIATGKSGVISGTVIKNPYFINLAGSKTYQKMWPVQVQRDIVPGDCGSWVTDALSGQLIGHIVAGDSTLRRVYMIQTSDIFHDIEEKLGKTVSLPNFTCLIGNAEDGLSPQQYAEAVSRLSMEGSSASIYSGTNYLTFAQYLNNPQGSNSQVSAWHPESASPQDSKHTTLYDFSCGQRSFVSSFEDPIDFNWVKQTRRHASSGSLIFLRGFSTPTWITTIGSECCVDPEFFRAHLDFLSYTDTFSAPTIPSSAKVFRLRVTSLGVLRNPKDVQDNWNWTSESMTSYYQKVKHGSGPPIGDSIVRKFSLFDQGQFAIEQDISVCLAWTSEEKWTVVVWMDAGNSLVTNPLEFLKGRGYLLPHIQHRRGNTITEMASTATDDTVAAHDEGWGQSVRILPFQYSRPLPPQMADEPDPFFSVLDLFEFSASSERHFLNMISSQIKTQMQTAFSPENTTITVLQTIAVSLQEHIQTLKQNIMTIKDRGGPQWPRTVEKNNSVLDAAVNRTLRDFESLLDDAISLSGHCKNAMSILMNLAAIEDSRRSTQLARSISIFTVLTVFFLPLSFAASVFSMNVEQFGAGSFDLRIWFLIAFSFLLFVLSTVFLLSQPQSMRRRLGAMLDRYPRDNSYTGRMLRRLVTRAPR